MGCAASARVRHVLFDADGVLQDLPGGWYAAMTPYLGDRTQEFLHKTWDDELPALAGQGDYMPLLAALLLEYDVTTPVDVVFKAVWHRIERVEGSFEIVAALRRGGYGVHLGTNQEQHRAGYMRTALGYDDLFDTSCYSYDVGVAKPEPQFFEEAARRIKAEPCEILFIDDSSRNVEGARSAGMQAEQWNFGQGHGVLRSLLNRHGINV
jgi:putative hydrolase of the HAD superfamily